MGERRTDFEGFTPQRWLNAGKLNQVLELQAALIDRAAADLPQVALEGVSYPVTVNAVSLLDVLTMQLRKAWFIAETCTVYFCCYNYKPRLLQQVVKQEMSKLKFVTKGEGCCLHKYLTVWQSSFTLWWRSLAILHKSNTARPRHSSWVLKGGETPASLSMRSFRNFVGKEIGVRLSI